MELMELCRRSKEVSRKIGMLNTEKKNRALLAVADALEEQAEQLLKENAKDLVRARANHMTESLLDRLMLDEGRIGQIAAGMRQVAALEDPVGEVLSMKKRPNGLLIGQKRVPIGVVGMIYEARPNVTADAFSLCFKTGNAVILKGGSDAMYSNISMVSIIQAALEEQEIPKDAVLLITDPSHEAAAAFMKMNAYVDVLIPRGGRGLIQTVVNQSTIPVIETGTGNCHIYVDESADFQMAADIICNAKTQRIGVCNACESLVVHERIAESFLTCLSDALNERSVEIRGDQNVCRILGPMRSRAALEEDWGREYLDRILSVKTVSSIEEAIEHINRYNTGHSEAIITKDYANAQKFLDEIDAACVYVNASTRFSDGFEFGFGAEIGISTQKLHARGPMGLNALTSTKYIIYGNGQIRP